MRAAWKRLALALAVAALGLWLATSTRPVHVYPVVSSPAVDPDPQVNPQGGSAYPLWAPE